MVTRPRPLRWTAVLALAVVGLTFLPDAAFAQRRGRPVRGGAVIVAGPRAAVGVGFYDPFWGPWGWGPAWSWGWGFGYPFGMPPLGPAFMGPAAGSARIRVFPTSAEVYVDGYMAGIVDDFDGFFQRLDVAPGEHELTFYLAGYQSVTQRVLFQPGKTLDIRYDLQPLPPGAPPDPRPAASAPPVAPPAGVVAPDDPTAQPPATRGPRPPGPRRVDRDPARGTQARGFGTLALRVQPADATIVIDGEEWTAPAGSGPVLIDLPEGAHQVEVRRDGQTIYERTIDVRAGRTQPLNVSVPR